MPNLLLDMVQMTVSGTPGTGTITLLAATSGYQSFATAGAQNKGNYSYSITDAAGAWEVGWGTYTTSGTTLTRNARYSSGGVGVAISLTSAAIVSSTILAEDMAAVRMNPVYTGKFFLM